MYHLAYSLLSHHVDIQTKHINKELSVNLWNRSVEQEATMLRARGSNLRVVRPYPSPENFEKEINAACWRILVIFQGQIM